MDRILEKKKWTTGKILTLSVIILGFVLILGFFLSRGSSRLNVKLERITISEVKKAPFKEFIPVNGVVQPHTTIYLDAIEGGRIEEKYVEDGAMVLKDQPILRLSNTDLELSLANQETAVFDVLTQMQNTKNNAGQNTIQQMNLMAEVDNAYIEAERVYKLNKYLLENNAIAEQEFISSENNYNYQIKRRALTLETLKKDSSSTKQQVGQMAQSYQRMMNALQLMRRKVGDLVVRAPISGQLTSLDAEIGQSRTKGERLGQIDVLNGFKVRAEIDEHYISRIYPGLIGEATIAGNVYQLEIKKVYSQVSNGRFQVEMSFKGKVPQGIRRGQTLQVRLGLSEETQAIVVPKGGFYQHTGGTWIFKLNENETEAFRTEIQLGRQNPEYYEVITGLQPGDKVITSGYENYEKVEELVLQSK